jgi:RNA polymerase sigma-70 factor (ECF subfamily)
VIASQRSHDRFATKRWSVVMQHAAARDASAQGAMSELARRYWYPVYAYLRHSGHAPAVAEGMSRAFLGTLLQEIGNGSQPPRGHFRRYLLEQLNVFLRRDWREIVGAPIASELAAPADLELRYGEDRTGATSPEQAYQRSFAQEVIARALRRLQAEASRAGHGAMFAALEMHLARDPGPGEHAALAQQLDLRPLGVAVALRRLRERFREMVGEELADTVVSADDLAAEQAELHAILSEPRGTQ